MMKRQGSAAQRRAGMVIACFCGVAGMAALTACGGGGGGGGNHSTAVRPSASNTTVVVTPSEGLAADDTEAAAINVTVRDASGQPMAGVEVEIAASGTGNTVTQPPTVTNPAGVASGSLTTTTAGAKTLTITLDPDGHAVTCTAHPVVRYGPRATVAGLARVADTDGNGTLDIGDTVTVKFSADVSCGSDSAAAFTLPVTGDTFGSGATMADGINADEVVITLGNNPKLRTRQAFDGSALSADSPDVAAATERRTLDRRTTTGSASPGPTDRVGTTGRTRESMNCGQGRPGGCNEPGTGRDRSTRQAAARGDGTRHRPDHHR